MPPDAKAFHGLERELLAPELARLGFDRPPGVGLGGWVRPEGADWLVVWTQLSRRNVAGDPTGFAFTLELQLGPRAEAGTGRIRRRIPGLLTDAQRQEAARIHAGVVGRTAPAGVGDRLLGALRRPDPTRARESDAAAFAPGSDPWFRYRDEDDLRRWFEFLADALPGAIERFLADASSGVSGRGA